MCFSDWLKFWHMVGYLQQFQGRLQVAVTGTWHLLASHHNKSPL